MDRREVIKSLSLTLGYTLTPSALTALLSSCAQSGTVAWVPAFLSADEAFAIEQLAETILPKTETPGAKDVKAVAFLDAFVSDIMELKKREKFSQGMKLWIEAFEERSQKSIKYSTPEDFQADLKYYFEIDEQKQIEIKELLNNDGDSTAYFTYSFLFTVKNLSMLGFYASEEIGENVLSYLPIPGNYQSCIPAEQIGNAWSLR